MRFLNSLGDHHRLQHPGPEVKANAANYPQMARQQEDSHDFHTHPKQNSILQLMAKCDTRIPKLNCFMVQVGKLVGPAARAGSMHVCIVVSLKRIFRNIRKGICGEGA